MSGPENDFNEQQVKATLARSPADAVLHRWVSIGGNLCGVRLNWVTTLIAIGMTWGFALACLARPEDEEDPFAKGQQWVTQNFTWLYILTQDVWCLFLIYLGFSRFGNLKLGADDEKPRYNDFTWFAMLFTCGVAVGLYVFGVAEPLYFYRQPVSWFGYSGSYDYAHTKTNTQTDAMRAQQAIFMAVYHWGIHGWVPYILLALLAGIVSFRWNMPMTIRSCFFPLLGDHALGLFGDFIDAISISTTTFGVCTSLGLGVSQLSSGLEFVMRIGCKVKDKCEDAGGVWRLDTYGTDMCYTSSNSTVTVSHDMCVGSWLKTEDSSLNAQYTIIACITLLATLSVLTGIDRGIKYLAKAAFLMGMIVMLVVLMGDNTWYLLNVMVQTTGYYLANVVQVGFDCEAFQGLGFEWNTFGVENLLWGSDGEDSVKNKLLKEGLSVALTTPDCGDQINPCTMGFISAAIAGAVSSAGGAFVASETAYLKGINLSQKSIDALKAQYALMNTAYPTNTLQGVPCGSGWNATHFDAFTKDVLGGTLDAWHCDLPAGDAKTACDSFWAGSFPRCPETQASVSNEWGACSTYQLSCPITVSYYDDSNPRFMDWWTIFYWAWWITWAPFVGFFVALISRGRTVREVIVGGFICPTIFAIIWFSVFGGLAIKMERTAEMALGVRPDHHHAAVQCAEHYSGDSPITPEAKKLAAAGYYMLSCMAKDNQIYYVMNPYLNLQGFLHFCLWLGLVIYFLTSSDSGSMTDDIIASSGLSAGLIPAWQKVFWCFTEGLVAIALIKTANGLNSLRALSIVIGLPYTIFLCMMVPSLYRALKKEMGDQDIQSSKRFNTQLLDILEGFQPHGGSPCTPAVHVKHLALALFVPALPIWTIYKKVWPEDTVGAVLYAGGSMGFYIAWIVCHILELEVTHTYLIAWLMFFFFLCIVVHLRVEMRQKFGVWGSPFDDIFVSLFMYPFVLAQCAMMAETDGESAPGYFVAVDEVRAEMASLSTAGAVYRDSSTSSGDQKPNAV
mmetsp:Transcript_22047/g.56275  ORF Transcript_22047/g.56275 Transcript_22047/m.56275 type:complete len:1013 (-) Transcript_22047:54-3092(-)